MVHDEVEKALLEEVETVKNCEKKLKQCMDRCVNQVRSTLFNNMLNNKSILRNSFYNAFQLTNHRAMQHQLQIDVQNKKTALGIDRVCHQMNNFSRGLQYYGGIERYDPR